MIGEFAVEPMKEGEEPVAGENFDVYLNFAASPPYGLQVSVSIDGHSLQNVHRVINDRQLSVPLPLGSEGRTLRVSALISDAVGDANWVIRPKNILLGLTEVFEKLTDDLKQPNYSNLKRFHQKRTWSYGDVENNGIYYHPNLTHYAHQAFEEFFKDRVGIHYVDLSRDTTSSQAQRDGHNIQRMTFPVEWLYQWMSKPMEAGDSFDICLDTVDLDWKRIAVRAWVLDQSDDVAAVVIWLRWALLLPDRKSIPIPSWFPRLPRGTFS